MAATDLSDQALGPAGAAPIRVELEATAGNVRAVILPMACRSVLIFFRASDGTTDGAGFVATSGTDGSAIGAAAFPVGAGVALSLDLLPGATIYLAGPAGGYAHLMLSRAS